MPKSESAATTNKRSRCTETDGTAALGDVEGGAVDGAASGEAAGAAAWQLGATVRLMPMRGVSGYSFKHLSGKPENWSQQR